MADALNPTRIEWLNLELCLTPETFAPRQSSIGLLDFARTLPLWPSPSRPKLLVDMCCGSGALGIALFLAEPHAFKELVLLDASPKAILSAETNRARYHIPGRTLLWQAGEALALDEPALIICNPPFLKPEAGLDLADWERRCVTAADQGLAVIAQCFSSLAHAPHHVILKSLDEQLLRVAHLDQMTHKLACKRLSESPEVAYSYWEPTGSEARIDRAKAEKAEPSRDSKFGIELEFFLTDSEGYPVLGATSAVIQRWKNKAWPNPPVAELGSFQIELNPGPWPLTPAGIERGLDELSRDVQHLYECAQELGCSVATAPFIPRIRPSQLQDPALLADDARSRATSAYFANSGAVVEFEDGESLIFPGETVLACLNEIHIHVQLENDERTLSLFNCFNQNALDIIRPFQTPIELNGKRCASACTTMRLFQEADGELNRDGNLRRVDFFPGTLQSPAEYDAAIASFNPIPCPELHPSYLSLESSVWLWTRLRGSRGDLRVEFRPMDMGCDWQARVRYLAETARRLSAEAFHYPLPTYQQEEDT